MVIRIIQASVVIFWILMTGLLVRSVYFPESSSLSRVPTRFVLKRFLANEVNSELTVLDRRREIGRVTVGASTPDSPEAQQLSAVSEIFLTGSVALAFPGAGKERFRFRATIWLNEGGESVHSDFALSSGRAGRAGRSRPRLQLISTKQPDGGTHYRVLADDRVLLDSKAGSIESDPQLQLLMAGFGIDLGSMVADAQGVVSGFGPITAHSGTAEIRGMRFSAFTVKVPLIDEHGLEFQFTRAGELMQILGFFDYEIIATDLCPVEDFSIPEPERSG